LTRYSSSLDSVRRRKEDGRRQREGGTSWPRSLDPRLTSLDPRMNLDLCLAGIFSKNFRKERWIRQILMPTGGGWGTNKISWANRGGSQKKMPWPSFSLLPRIKLTVTS